MQTTEQKLKMKGSNKVQAQKHKRSGIQNQEQEKALLNDTLKLIDSLFEMRFIQKISRPIEKRVKDQYVEKFAGKMQSLHNKLDRIRTQICDRALSQNGNNKNKSIAGSVTHKPLDLKKTIRAIQNRYIQVFVEGSFKFYGKLYALNSFSYNLRTINITEWAAQCVNQQVKQSSCC